MKPARRSSEKNKNTTSLPLSKLHEEQTRQQLGNFSEMLLASHSPAEIKDLFNASILELRRRYDSSHNGYAAISSHPDFISLDEFVAVFQALKIFYWIILENVRSDVMKGTIAIGVISPAIQDIGKDIIRFTWLSEGYDVVDLGKNVKPERFFSITNETKPDIIAVSCMRKECISSLEKVLDQLRTKGSNTPVIIGGVAVNPVTAYQLREDYGIPVYYCKDVTEAPKILQQALGGAMVTVPIIREPKKYDGDGDLIDLAGHHGFTLHQIPVSDIVIDAHARDRCDDCVAYKKERCPLELGYERQLPLEESKAFINRFSFALLVSTPLLDSDLSGQPDADEDRRRWNGLLTIESRVKQVYGDAFSMKFPLICPFCSLKMCTLRKGYCLFESSYRETHEKFNINIGATCSRVFGDAVPGDLFAIVLGGLKPQ